MTQSLQETYAARSICFGCGPANAQGLGIRSFPDPEYPGALVARWRAKPYHEAFPGMLNGGIIGALLDCHSNWTAAYTLMKAQDLGAPPCSVTADFSVRLKRPTPSQGEILVRAKPVEIAKDRVKVEAELLAEVSGELKVCATCVGTFVAVTEGHPAYHRW